MKHLAATTLALALTAASGSAFAYQDGYGYGDNGYNGPDRNYYNGDGYQNASNGPRSDYAQVVRVDPIISRYGDQYGSNQRQECWNERTNRYDSGYYRDNSGRLYRGDGRTNTNGALLGALIGGALGNQVGKGDGRTAATIAGAVIGASVGGHTGRDSRYGSNYDSRYGNYDQYSDNSGVVRRCRLVNDYGNNGYGNNGYDQSVSGYNVTYRYAGQTYHAVTNYHPGRTIRVVVDVRLQDDNVAYTR
jgi:uncharacterized protein YcfJ